MTAAICLGQSGREKNIISISCAAKVELAVPACGGISADKIHSSFGYCDPMATINHKPREDAFNQLTGRSGAGIEQFY